MRTKASGAAVVAVGLLTLAVPSAASAVPDASCPAPTAAVIGQPGDNRGAQTFTAQNTGALTRAQVEIDKAGSPGGDWILSINAVDGSGTPTNTVLATTTIPDASVPDGVSMLTGDFASPAALTAGQRYAVVFTRPGADTLRIRYSISNPCPEVALFSFSQTGPFGPVCGPPDDPCDLRFAVFVTPPAAPGPAGPASPSNAFTVGKVKGGKLTVTVPGPGEVDVTDVADANAARAVAAARKRRLKPSSATATAAGQVTVKLKLTRKAKKKLKQKGKVKVKAAITFTPTGGTPNTETAKLKVKK